MLVRTPSLGLTSPGLTKDPRTALAVSECGQPSRSFAAPYFKAADEPLRPRGVARPCQTIFDEEGVLGCVALPATDASDRFGATGFPALGREWPRTYASIPLHACAHGEARPSETSGPRGEGCAHGGGMA